MFSKILKQLFKNKFTTAITLLVVIIGGYFGYQAISGGGEAVRYTVAAVEKGTLIVSVSGSGQVTVLEQVDVKPKVSANLTALYIDKDEEVKAGRVLAILDSTDAQRAVSEAEIALDEAKEKLEDLISPADEQSIRQAEIALAQAERNLNKARESYENIDADIENSLATAYQDGYQAVASAFLKLSSYMNDLKDVLGRDTSSEEYISGYQLVLGKDSSFIERLLFDYYQARDPFNKNYAFFMTVFQDDEYDTVYQLIEDTLETTELVSRTLDSARHMYDAAVLNEYYKQLNIASQIDKMKPKIESDASGVSSVISSLRKIKDAIDDTVKNTPEMVEDAEWALESLQEKFDEKKLALGDLLAGPDSKTIKSQENIVAQKEKTLADAQEKLANHTIRAPFDGIIAATGNVKKGEAISSGTTLATIITKQKIAEMTLNEIDAAKVKSGQKATLTFDALPDISVAGRVIEIDTVGKATQGVVSYGVKIAFDTDIEQVKPGMSVAADIITEAKPDVLVLPSNAIKSQGNSYYVELVEADEEFSRRLLANVSGTILPTSPKLQLVEIGLSNDLSTEIISGLKEGDLVVASTINTSATQTTQTRTTQAGGFQIPGMTGGSGQIRTFSR